MTKPTISLTELVEKGADADLLKRMIQFVAQRIIEFDVEGQKRVHKKVILLTLHFAFTNQRTH